MIGFGQYCLDKLTEADLIGFRFSFSGEKYQLLSNNKTAKWVGRNSFEGSWLSTNWNWSTKKLASYEGKVLEEKELLYFEAYHNRAIRTFLISLRSLYNSVSANGKMDKSYTSYVYYSCRYCSDGIKQSKRKEFVSSSYSGLKISKTAKDILSRYLFPYKIHKIDYKECIKIYVATKINAWKLKGEFETSIKFQKRVNMHTRNEMLEKYLIQAIDHFKRERINLISDQDISLGEYNADSQTFSIIITDFGSLNFPVPMSKAPSFKATFNSSNFSKLDLSLKNTKFLVSHIEYKYKGEDVFIYDIPDNICSSGDCVNGYGVFISEEGTYKGHWKDGKVHGSGVFDGILYSYDGEYLAGKKHGNGKKTYIDNYIEEGLFENGSFIGDKN